ncbi:MAG: uroporphyrinogen decarboxylase [Granulosicoccus sp.]|nr:uroporphyrinogen decarboxylase [Granulosicoccus sp.]
MSTVLQNDLYLRALNREELPRTPVWVMRQAGRYLPEYLRVRQQAGDFMTLCSTPELACEVTLQPVDRFNLDAAILFSDILTIPDAMGLGLHFEPGEGPRFSNPVRTPADVRNLPVPDPMDKLRYVMDAVSTIRRELNGRVPLIGFSGSPWTLATYMVEGGGSKDFSKVKGMLFSDPSTLHELLNRTTQSVIAYLNAQVSAGAQSLMIFDTWGGVLSPANYREFSLGYMQQIVDGLTREADGRKVPIVLFTKNGGQWLDVMADTGCDGLGVDWTTDLADARARTQDRVALQGNLDPSALYGSPERIRVEVKRVLDSFGTGPGHVFNLGHGIHQHVNPEHLGVMVEAVRELSARNGSTQESAPGLHG